jgi:hypothetical protein
MKHLLACAAFAFATLAHADAPRFAWHAPLAIDGTHAFYRVELPANVYEGVVRSDLADVRVRNGDGEPVPFAFVPVPSADRERAPAADLPLFPLYVDRDARDLADLAITMRRDASGTRIDLATRDGRPVTGQRLAGYLIDAGERHAPLAALTLVTSDTSKVDTRVRIEASDDLATWRSLVSAAPLLALEFRGRHLVRDRVELPAVAARYLRVAFVPAAHAVEIASARGEAAPRVVEPARQWRKAAGTADARHPGEYLFDVGGYFPVDRVTLDLPDLNAVAPAVLSAAWPVATPSRGAPDDAWRHVVTSVFYRLRQDDGETTNVPVSVPTTAARRWKVRIDPSTGALGGTPPSLSVGYVPRTLVFAARGTLPFELAWGSAKATAAALPIATLVPAFDARTTPATFGVASVGAAPAAPAFDALREPPDVKRWLLWTALAVATMVLGWMAFGLLREMRAPPSGDRDAEPPV